MRILAAILVAVVLAAGAPQTTLAQGVHNCARQAVRTGRILPLGVILARVRQRVAGRVVGVNLFGCPNGPFVYRLRLLTRNGRLAIVDVNARTGRIRGARGAGRIYRRPMRRPARRPWYRRRR